MPSMISTRPFSRPSTLSLEVPRLLPVRENETASPSHSPISHASGAIAESTAAPAPGRCASAEGTANSITATATEPAMILRTVPPRDIRVLWILESRSLGVNGARVELPQTVSGAGAGRPARPTLLEAGKGTEGPFNADSTSHDYYI